MIQKDSRSSSAFIFICLSLVALAAGCIKSSDSTIVPSHSKKFEKENLKKALVAIDTLSLFYQALERVGYSSMLETNNAFTLFPPGNAAMKAAGLDVAGLQTIAVDSLRKIIAYHIIPGALDNSAFERLPTTKFIQTFRNDTVQVPFQGFRIRNSWVSVQRNEQLYVNGFAFNSAPVETANGYIYPINVFLKDPPVDERLTVWELIETDPELSMYRDAIILLDSIKESDAYFEPDVYGMLIPPPSDIPILATRKSNAGNNTFISRAIPTVLAPTNQAFYDAGFHSIDDLREFAYRYPFGIKAWASDDYSEITVTYRFSSLDTLLTQNFLVYGGGEADARYPARVLYPDMLKGQINNGTFNRVVRGTYEGIGTYVKYAFDLQFSGEHGTAYVKWGPGSNKVMIPKDQDPMNPVNNFNLDNGVLFKVGKLFYPFN